ncbi:MAG: class I SAM-dependent methyltransferase [Mangrovibacterium sp.]
MNLFENHDIAGKYDLYYQTDPGKSVDKIEKALVRKSFDRIFSREMLELGCGTGHWTKFFCDEGFRVTAIDESEAMLEQAGKKDIANAVFRKADAAHLPFPDQSFSSISSVTMFEFVENVDRVLDEIDRVLQPGGHLRMAERFIGSRQKQG